MWVSKFFLLRALSVAEMRHLPFHKFSPFLLPGWISALGPVTHPFVLNTPGAEKQDWQASCTFIDISVSFFPFGPE